MKKLRWLHLLAIALLAVGCATTEPVSVPPAARGKVQIKEEMSRPISSVPTSADLGGDITRIRVEDRSDRVYVTITNPRITPAGTGDTKGEGLKTATEVKIASGILDAAGKDPYFVLVKIKNGWVSYDIPNYAQRAGVPVIEHNWGIGIAYDGAAGHLVLDPNDPWVSYKTALVGGYKTISGEKADLETLIIGLAMYPNKPTVSLKSLGKGKLVQGKHPEL